jgi:hypothetical protein
MAGSREMREPADRGTAAVVPPAETDAVACAAAAAVADDVCSLRMEKSAHQSLAGSIRPPVRPPHCQPPAHHRPQL